MNAHESAETCKCKTSPYIYVWSSTYGTCVRDCSTIINSPKTVNVSDASYNSCNCDSHYVWNTDSYPNICSKDCSTDSVTYSDGTNADALTCNCKVGYKWDTSQCVLDCGSVADSPKTNFNVTHCNCN